MSRKNRFRTKDKITQKITRDGLVEVNAVTGEEICVSQRSQDINLREGNAPEQEAPVRDLRSPEPVRRRPPSPFKNEEPTPGVDQPDSIPENPADASFQGRLHFNEEGTVPTDKVAPQQGTPYYRKLAQNAVHPHDGQTASETGGIGAKDTPAAHQAARSVESSGGAQKPSKLQFALDEQAPPVKKLVKAQIKSEKTADKLEKARHKLPSRKKIGQERVFNEKKNTQGYKIRFETEGKPQRANLKDTLPLRPVRAVGNLSAGYAHSKLFQAEQENVGTQAAHKGELLAEGGLRTAYRLHKTAPYRRVAKLERLSAKHNARVAYQKLLHENPRLRTNLLSRFIQKQKIKRQYAKAVRESGQVAQMMMEKVGVAGGKLLKIAAGFVRRHPMVVGAIALLLLVVFSFSALFTSSINMAAGGLSSILMSSYTAGDADIDNAELLYREWETDLEMRIQKTETDHPGYDEYRYNIGNIGHNPFELMAYLSAKYQDFTLAAVQAELQRIFNEQYTLEFVTETEIRYRTVTHTDPETGEEYEVEESYEWHILNVRLTSKPFTDVVMPGLPDDELEMYDLYMQTKGNRQYMASPFDFDWIPYVTCYYGWRVHPITGEKDNHKGIDIGVPVGTDILAGHDGKVVQAAFDANGYGYYIVIEGKDGLVSKYAHCDSLLAGVGQTVKKGDIIAKSGNTGRSTGPHLHMEVLKNGYYLNPLFFAESPDADT